ncbi:MAG: glycerol-3-phosphate 1-O-acyltransferase PlsY [Clostridia bacterium]|nr:glycerol-3-phosphate 1-O-acyltransferase PlsY [Clostridia bacterium]
MIVLKVIATVVIGYLLGCISTGIIASRLLSNIDIRKEGSGNAGATNMLRTLGWVPSLVTFAGDTVKAVAACWLGSLILGRHGAYIAGIACVIGHNWPVFFGFKGGKGVSSSFGVLLFTCPPIALIVFVLEIVIVALTKTMSLASISAAVANVILSVIFLRSDPFCMICGFILSVLLIFRHHSNVKRLLFNSENKLDFKTINKLDFRSRKKETK